MCGYQWEIMEGTGEEPCPDGDSVHECILVDDGHREHECFCGAQQCEEES